MKTSILFLISLLLFTVEAKAQPPISSENINAYINKTNLHKDSGQTAKQKSNLSENQKYMGAYETDELASYGIGLPKLPGQLKAGVLLNSGYVENFNGGKIIAMRFGLCASVGGSRVFVTQVSNKGDVGEDVVSQEVQTTEAGWNYVELEKPYTIGVSDGNTLLIGFDYTQVESSDEKGHPLSLVGKGIDGGACIYANKGQGYNWYSMGTDNGNLSVQCIVEKQGITTILDVTLDKLSIQKYAKAGGYADIDLTCHNFSSDAQDCVFGVKVNDKEITDLSTNGEVIPQTPKSFSFSISMPSELVGGEAANITLYVKSVAGKAPSGDLSGDTLHTQTKIYTTSMKRGKQLIEHFTSQYNPNAPEGIEVIDRLNSIRDDLAWVSIHCDYSNQKVDEYTIPQSRFITDFSTQTFNAVSVNRGYMENDILNEQNTLAWRLDTDTQNTQSIFDLFKKGVENGDNYYPAFASIDLNTSYDKTSRRLNISVSGSRTEEAETLVGGEATVNIYLVEDGLIAQQNDQGAWIKKYKHNHVLRSIVTKELGDRIEWNGNDYQKDYSLVLDNGWNADRMHVIVFISRPIHLDETQQTFTTDKSEAEVLNTERVKLGENSYSGVLSVTDHQPNISEKRRYTIDGRQASPYSKGVILVKYSDGTIRKMIR